MKTASIAVAALACGFLSACDGGADTRVVDFNWDVRPILSNNCFRCHGPDAEARKAGLRLDRRDAATGELPETRGKFAIVPGSPADSELIRRISSADPDVVMPPPSTHLALQAKDVDVLRAWIEQGAEYKPHWSYLAPEKLAPPSSRFDARAPSAIDRFVLARLEREGLEPSPEADRETLINRVTLTLTGLPPTPEEVDAFVADDAPDAYERLVDRLLARPAYGERMASDWLDAARFADSDGYLDDEYQRLLYPWRDWVIAAFNRNMPYDQFGTWQLAGDLLDDPTKEQRLATVFGRLHRRSAENGIIDEEYRVEYVLDRTDTVGTAFLGLSVGCARCHDHKFDAISHVDYYSLAAFFNSTDDAGLYPQEKWATGPIMLMTDDATDARIAELHERIASLEARYSERARAAAGAVSARAARAAAEPERARTLAELRAGLAAAQRGYYPFDEAVPNAKLAAAYAQAPGLEPSQPRLFSAAGMSGLRPAVLQAPIIKPGARGNALFFDANNRGFLDKADKLGWVDHTDSFSVDLWVYPDKTYEEAAVINHSDHLRYGSGGWSVDLEGNRVKVQLVHANPRDQITVVSRDALPPKTWVHVTLTYDGSAKASGVGLYFDGKPASVEVRRDGLTMSMLPLGITFAGLDGFNGLAFGKRWQQSPLEGGAIDELRIFGRRLSPLEVAVLHDAGPALDAPEAPRELAAHWTALDDGVAAAGRELRQAREELNRLLTAQPAIMTLGDTAMPRPSYVLKRGQYSSHGEEVFPRGLQQIFPYDASLPRNRLGLAKWIFDARNPLTARVYVNRLWQMQFGTGLVRTAEELGVQGEAPTHPELLDWLARELVDSGWDVKHLNKLIVTSATFRQSSNATPAQVERDPDNRWLGRGPQRRMPAEMIRDNVLAASGLLDATVGGRSVYPYQPDGVWEAINIYERSGPYPRPETVPDDQHRRSLYSMIRRGAPVPSMTIFDFPRRHQAQARRPMSSTPLQALVLLNDPQYVEASRALAERAMHASADLGTQLATVFRLAARRAPSPAEAAVLRRFFDAEREAFASSPEAAEKYLHVGVDPPDASIDPGSLAALASAANVVLNSPDSYMLR
jgi:hypothetical protein